MRWSAALGPSIALLASSAALTMHHHHHSDGTISALRQACRSSCESPEVQVAAVEGEEDFCSLCERLGVFKSSSPRDQAQSASTQDAMKDLLDAQKPVIPQPRPFQSPLSGFGVLEDPCSSSLEPLDGDIGSAVSSSKASSSGSWGETIGSAFSSTVASASGSVRAAGESQTSSSSSSSRSSFALVIKDSVGHVVENTGPTTAPATTSDEDIVVVVDGSRNSSAASGSGSVASRSGSDGTLCLSVSCW